ncbi:MAG: IS4 family transposase [Actinobacteria bacterium]|nr:IS4 family transposase [Actinomycetota bacterium]
MTDHLSLGVLTKTVSRYIVDEILNETDSREKRSRSLPAHVVVYFVLALSLFHDGYEEVLRKLVNGLRFARVWSTAWSVPTTGAISQARQRLGAAPMKALFERVAAPLATAGTPGAWLAGRRLMALDGVMLDMPDTAKNLERYPTAVGGTRRPFPQLRAVGLSECSTHAIIAAALGSIRTGERELAGQLLDAVTDDMLIIADRGFFSYQMWSDLLDTGADLLFRAWSTMKLTPVEILPDGTWIAEIHRKTVAGGKTRILLDNIGDTRLATHIRVRVIEYQITRHRDAEKNTETFRLITTILDPNEASAIELASAYHQRWEIETAFHELEVQLLATTGLRSKTPDMVEQEFWGLLVSHYATRAFMQEAADSIDIDPDRLSFTRTLNIIRRRVTDPAPFSPRSTTDGA